METINMTNILNLETTKEEFAAMLSDPKSAIMFALYCLEAFEVSEFLTEWLNGDDLTSWLSEWKARQEVAVGNWNGRYPTNGGE